MFAIATPQTVELYATKPVDPNDPRIPTPPESHGTATFSHPHDDVSECELTIASKDKVWTFRFNVNGGVISTTYEDDEIRGARTAAAKKAEDEQKSKVEAQHEPA